MLANLATAYCKDPERRRAIDGYLDVVVGVAVAKDEDMARGLLRFAALIVDLGGPMPPALRRILPAALNGAADGHKAYQVIAGTVGKRGHRVQRGKDSAILFRYIQLTQDGVSAAEAEAIIGGEVNLSAERVNQIVDKRLREPKRRTKAAIAKADELLSK